MIQLAFEPAFDPFHAVFRILRQLEFSSQGIDTARVKILDVFVAEPKRCLGIRVPPTLRKRAKLAAACQPATYGSRPRIETLFNRMSPMQDAAVQTLVMQGLLDPAAFEDGMAKRTKVPLTTKLAARIASSNDSQRDLMTFLLNDLGEISFDGPNGLKARTGLMEFRYDVI